MGTEAIGIAKSVLQMRAGLKTESSGKDGQEASVDFMTWMNQSSLPNMNTSKGSAAMDLNTASTDTAKTAYDTSQKPIKSVSVKENATPEEVRSEAAESIQDFEEEIRSILKEKFGVTDEQISDALEQLGITLLDVTDLQGLSALVQALTGENLGALFLNEAFGAVMEQTAAAIETLCAELGITKEELTMLCEAWSQMEQSTDIGDLELTPEILNPAGEQTSPEAGNPSTDTVASDMEAVKEQPTEEMAPVAAQENVDTSKEEASFKQPAATAKEAEAMNQPIAETEEGAEAGKQSFDGQFSEKAKQNDMSQADLAFGGVQSADLDEFAIPQEHLQPYTSAVDVADIIQQIARNVQVTISTEVTSMEMQLNPENLGRIYLHISEKEGAVRAQIAAQNETVKELLETQLVELRQSLNQQGVKVDAIEVTVATHEFEQNLEQNAKQEEQMQQQREESQKQARRSLNLNDLDGLSGLMTEEEALAAKIMRDNGNQVDFTA